MIQQGTHSQRRRRLFSRSFMIVAAWLVMNGAVMAQGLDITPALSAPAPIGAPLRIALPPIPAIQINDAALQVDITADAPAPQQVPDNAQPAVRRLTLEQAQQIAAATSGPLARLAQLQLEVAKQHRLGVQSLYFPNVSLQYENLNFNKHPGELFSVTRPLAGTTVSVPVNIIEQHSNAVNLAVAQPITPVLAVRQLVKIARADETIARAKLGRPVTDTAMKIEKNYYELLIAQRELVSVGLGTKKVQARLVRVSTEPSDMDTEKALVLAASKVKELTASLNDMLGFPQGTRLDLVPPVPLTENLSMADAVAQSLQANTDVVEAEQTAVKAHAGSTLAKMEYFPSFALIGGWSAQDLFNVVLPDRFAYVGVIATYTVFDSGKRERGVKERAAQVKAAELGVELTKAKASGAVKTAYFELERAREVYQLARRMMSAIGTIEARFIADNPEGESARARAEADLFRAELDYRAAYAKVQSLMGHN